MSVPSTLEIDCAEPVLRCTRFSALRFGRYFVVDLHSPHRVLSTADPHGGQMEGLRFLLNHQICEAQGDEDRLASVSRQGPERHHRETCLALGIEPALTAAMGTAANMACLAHKHAFFEGLRADAFVTAGVRGNAATAGDPASWSETEQGWREVPSHAGTINTILMLSFPVTCGALARAVGTLTEAKSAALADLAIGSLSSSSIATGTGTDQYCIASPLDPGRKPKAWTGTHSKAGEIIGRSVREAVTEALRWQNGLEASFTRGFFHALGRFGLTEQSVLLSLERLIPPASLELLKRNLNAVFYEPQVGAAAYAIAAVMDRVRLGTFPDSAADGAMRQHAACLASSLAQRPQDWPSFHAELSRGDCQGPSLVVRAVALGWQAKWS